MVREGGPIWKELRVGVTMIKNTIRNSQRTNQKPNELQKEELEFDYDKYL